MTEIESRGLSRRDWMRAWAGGMALGLPARAALGQAGNKLTIGFLAFPNWCQLAAAEYFGWLKAEGIEEKLDIRYFESGPPEIEAAIGGNLQLMGLGAGPVINAIAAGALPLRILGSVNEVTLLFGLVAQKEFNSVADLRGKKIAVTLGTNYQYFLEAALADAGLKTSDVTLVDSQPNEGTISFLAGRVDATVPDYSDTKIIPRRREGAKVLITGADIGKAKGGPTFRIFDLWVATGKGLEENRPTIAKILRAVSHWADLVTDPATRDQAIDFAADWSAKMSAKALKRDDIVSTMESATFFNAAAQKKITGDGALATALQQHAEFLFRFGKLKRVPDFDAAVDKSIW